MVHNLLTLSYQCYKILLLGDINISNAQITMNNEHIISVIKLSIIKIIKTIIIISNFKQKYTLKYIANGSAISLYERANLLPYGARDGSD